LAIENFNSLGSGSNATMPANWKLSSAGTGISAGWTTGTNIGVTNQAANTGTPTAGGAYNWGSASGTDRAPGFMTSSIYGSPNAIMSWYRNTTGMVQNSITVSFQIERYKINADAFSLQFFSSTDGNSWNAQSGGDIGVSLFATGAVAYSFSSPKTIAKTVVLNIPGGLNNNADIFFKWVFNTGTNSQGLGLDNVAVFAGAATPVIVATLRDILQVDMGIPNQFNEGDVIRYETILKNTGTGDATNIQITLPTPPTNTTLVANSIKTSTVALDDNFIASYNTTLIISSANGVLLNDVGIPVPTAVISYGTTADPGSLAPGTTGVTDAGGTITLNANGSFNYTPPTGFSGTDKFRYITGNGNLPNNDATVTITVTTDITFSTVNQDPSCNNGTNGSITFNASGGNGTLQYSITGAGGTYQSSNVFTGLSAGTYNLAVKDQGGYIKTSTTTLNNPPLLVINGPTPVNIVYNTTMTTVTYTKTGGTGAVTWSASGLPAGININASTGDLTGVSNITGIYAAVITVTDANGCTGTKSVTINVAPKLSNDNFGSVVGNTQLVSNGHSTPGTPFTTDATNILTNDASNSTITVTAVTNAATTAGGSITIDALGKFTYSPPNGYTGSDNYTYTASSAGVSATATISFTISNMVWYVNNTYAGGSGTSNGSSHRPYTDMAAASTAAQVNQIIYIHTGAGNTSGNTTLKSGQTLRGAGNALNVGALTIVAGTKPILNGTITVANNVTVDGFDQNTGSLTALTNA
jgi:hypothetical protein